MYRFGDACLPVFLARTGASCTSHFRRFRAKAIIFCLTYSFDGVEKRSPPALQGLHPLKLAAWGVQVRVRHAGFVGVTLVTMKPVSKGIAVGLSEQPMVPTQTFDVELIRSVLGMAGIPSLRQVFSGCIPQEPLRVDAARRVPPIHCGDLTAAPVFLTAGWRNVPAPVFNESFVRRISLPFVRTNGECGAAEVVIREACRNVGQHACRATDSLRHGFAQFASAGVFVKNMVCVSPDRREHSVLLCMVADEGRGISNPSASLVDGVGTAGGEDHRGMGIELSGSLLTLIKSNQGRWFLYDGLHHAREQRARTGGRTVTEVPSAQRVEPLAELNLPGGTKGCQKIFLFAHPMADKDFVFQQAVTALSASAIQNGDRATSSCS